jgi:hypothetical protein
MYQRTLGSPCGRHRRLGDVNSPGTDASLATTLPPSSFGPDPIVGIGPVASGSAYAAMLSPDPTSGTGPVANGYVYSAMVNSAPPVPTSSLSSFLNGTTFGISNGYLIGGGALLLGVIALASRRR